MATMGSVLEGFEAARTRQEALLAERHQREKLADDELRALGSLLDADGELMRSHNMTHTVTNRTMHVNHNGSPILIVHYDSIAKQFRLTVMKDGSHTLSPSLEECGRSIGAFIYDLHVAEDVQ